MSKKKRDSEGERDLAYLGGVCKGVCGDVEVDVEEQSLR